MAVKPKRDLLAFIGVFLILAGVLCNPWLLGPLVSLPGQIYHTSLRLGLWICAAVLICAGLFLVLADRRKLRRNLPNFALLVATVLFTAGVAYTGWVSARSMKMYRHLKTGARGWRGHLYQTSAELGFEPLPGSRGFMTFTTGPELPVRNDENGFRVPAEDSAATPITVRPLVLSLGCSVTYGDACSAEDAFTYRVGRALGGSSINGGVCSYGLEQMLPLAQKLIPKYKPDYVLVQFSGWLVARAISGFAPTYYGKVPVPFYALDDSGRIYLHPRLFEEKVFQVPISDYRGGTWGLFNYFSFLGRVGFPLFVHDDIGMLGYYLRDAWSKLRHGHSIFIEKDISRELINYIYGEIAKVCRENGTHLVVVALGRDSNHRKTFNPPDVADMIYVDAEAELCNRLPDTSPDTYNKAYGHWRGNPPALEDSHPNPEAHRIIAETIVKAIQEHH